MRKLLALLLAAMMVFVLGACGENDNPDPNSDNPGASQNGGPGGAQDGTQDGMPSGDVGDIDFGSIMNGNGSTDTIYGQLDEATKQQIIEDAKMDGVDVSFSADGSMTVVDTDGTVVVQKPDGTWVVKDADGSEGQLGGNWPDNEFTRLVPKPDFELFAAEIDDNEFTVAFLSATIEQIRDYAAKVKAAGFNMNEVVEDQEMMGIVIYSFSAENTDGYTVEITSAVGTSAMTISK